MTPPLDTLLEGLDTTHRRVGVLLAGLGAVISLFVRFRRTRGHERQQIKWFASAAALTQGRSLLLWLDAGSEPTEHLLNELLANRDRIRDLRLLLLLPTRQALRNEKLCAVLAAFPAAEVWLTDDSAEPAARSAYVVPDRLPLLLLCDRPRHILHASAGYRIGSISTALTFCRPEPGTTD